MNFITSHIDELLFNFPVNDVTTKMRKDLEEATECDFNQLIATGMNEEESSNTIISRIASAEQIASMIPNKHSKIYLIYWAIALAITAFVFSYVSNPDFLQIFLPTRMEFPDIIEKFILYFFTTCIAYAGILKFYRLLPQKYLDRNEVQSAALLYLGTVMSALYFSIAIAFVWYTFNGFLPHEITTNIISAFTYYFYKVFFSSKMMVFIYAILNAAAFVASHQTYHLETKAEPYSFEKVYVATKQKTIKQEPTEDPVITVTEEVLTFIAQENQR